MRNKINVIHINLTDIATSIGPVVIDEEKLLDADNARGRELTVTIMLKFLNQPELKKLISITKSSCGVIVRYVQVDE